MITLVEHCHNVDPKLDRYTAATGDIQREVNRKDFMLILDAMKRTKSMSSNKQVGSRFTVTTYKL